MKPVAKPLQEVAKQLQESLSAELQDISNEINDCKGYDLRRDLVKDGIKKLKKYVAEHPFPDKTAEIHYYKYIAPSFYWQLLYFNRLCILELNRITLEKEEFISYLKKELKKTKKFLKKNRTLFQYFYSQQDFHDEELFTREKTRKRRDNLSIDMDDHYCEDSWQLSRILTSKQYSTFLKKELEEPAPDLADITFGPMDCDANKSDAVAMAVAIYEVNWFQKNGKPFTFKEVVKRTEQYLNMDLKDYQGLDQASRNTHGDPAVFANFKKAWTRRKERLADKNDQKK